MPPPSLKQPLPWGGRDLSEEETFKELEILWKEFFAGRLDPWDEGPLDTSVWFEVSCVATNMSNFSFGFSSKLDGCFFYTTSTPDRIRKKIQAFKEYLQKTTTQFI